MLFWHQNGLEEILLLSNQRINLLLRSEVVFNWLLWHLEPGFGQEVYKILIRKDHEQFLLFIRHDRENLFQFLPKRQFGTFFIVLSEVSMEIEWLFLFRTKELQNLVHEFPNLRKKFKVRQGLLNSFHRVQF